MVYILLGPGFEEAEALVTADVVRRGEIPVALAGIGGSEVTGAHAITVRADVLVEEAVLSPGDMVVLPGGLGGVSAIEGSKAAMDLARQAGSDPAMWLAAICAAPALLGRAGLLAPGSYGVCYPGMEGELSRGGAVPVMDQPVVTHGRLITGKGPGVAFEFGLAVVEALAGADRAAAVRRALCCPL